jgi:type I restriction enzyme, S subunit
MIGEGKTRGQAAILDIEAGNNQNSAAIRVSEAGYPPEYIFWFLVSEYERTRTVGSGNNQPALNKQRVRNLCFPLAPLSEQKKIAAQLEQTMSVTSSLKGQIKQSLVRAARLRQAILKKAFEGKLVPQDPNDEPASVLLERIRASQTVPRTRARKIR